MTVDYKDTLLLPHTAFPMRAGLPKKEPEILKRWVDSDLYGQLRAQSQGRKKFVLHDGPPYANGNIHIGTGLNKILKDVINRTQQMSGKDANYVPGWDCHGLPIEWKVEEQYRAKGKDKDAVPVNEFRAECREFAEHWVDVQSREFQRLGVVGRWNAPYLTMDFRSEALIAAELMKFAASGKLYRGSKPVMWSVVERTALAEAEVEYHDHESDTIWAKFPVISGGELDGASVVIWTTTPWTIPGNRAICFSARIDYGLYSVTEAPEENWARVGDRLILANALAEDVMTSARVEGFEKLQPVSASTLTKTVCIHPLRDAAEEGYGFDVPLLPGDHVTDEAGTGFVHTAPGHGREDFEVWTANEALLKQRGIDTAIPFTVGPDGAFTGDAPRFKGEFVITDKGKKGGANKAVIDALVRTGALIARGRLKHQYPHSWRSKKPVIFRNTPQWFISMGDGETEGLRNAALREIGKTRFVPSAGQNRLHAMIGQRPDWVISRQRTWGVPITVFAHPQSAEVLVDEAVNQRILAAFEQEGADAWFEDGARERFLGPDHSDKSWEKVNDSLDVWFESGCTHAFCLEQELDELEWPASLYLEGSDQHRGWFHSSLLESCGTRNRAPYKAVLTHGFTMDEEGRKMSKSLGNTIAPQDVINQYGADILRLWVIMTDYMEDQRIGPEILKQTADAYRRLRNTIRFLLGSLSDFDESERVSPSDMPELERSVLHRLAELDARRKEAVDSFDLNPFCMKLLHFCSTELSAFYFDIRKDSLYCDRADNPTRRAARTVLDTLFDCLISWLAPITCFTAEEAWMSRHGNGVTSVHLKTFPNVPTEWRDDALAQKWSLIRALRRVVTGALEEERAAKKIGSSLDAAPIVQATRDFVVAMQGVDLAEIAITSSATLVESKTPQGSFTMQEVAGVAVTPTLAEEAKCARCWKRLPDVDMVEAVPETCGRCADAVQAHG